LEHLRVLEIELALADLESVETKINRMQKAARMDKSLEEELGALTRAQENLAEGRPLYRATLSKDDLTLLAPHFLLTTRRVLAVVNVAEN
ncbi:MAG TPA: redox-regulated ATPase YchF, partial [Acidimicrobium sp.]|nr:redox-regulated ATPase YchF [Acidimicrobium sp.]